MNWYLKVLREHYSDFAGRARRREYWMFVLVNMIAVVLLGVTGTLVKLPWLSMLYGLGVLVPSLAVSVRRLHDIGRSGRLLLVSLVPVAGGIYLLYLFCLDGEKKLNRWGANPKA